METFLAFAEGTLYAEIRLLYLTLRGFPGGSENLPAKQETWVRFLGWEGPLEKEIATYSSILAWESLGTEEPGWLQPTGSQVSHAT